MIVSIKADNCIDLFFIKKSLSQQPCKMFVNFVVFAPLTDPTMWYMLIFKSTPVCEPNSKSVLKPELFEERGLIFIIISNSQSPTGASDIYTINKK